MCPQVGFFKTWLSGVSGLMFLSDFYAGDSFICKPWWYEEAMKRAMSSFSFFFFSEHSNALLFCSLHHLDRHPCHPILMVRRLLGGVYNHRMWTTKKEQRGESREIFHNWTLFPAMKHFPKKSLNRSLKVKHVSLVDSSVGKPKERGPWFTVELDDGIPLYYNYPVWLPKFLFDLQFFRLSSSSFLQTCIFNKLSIKKNQKPFEN